MVRLPAPWLKACLSFDTETTGVDLFADRIVSAHAIDVGLHGAYVRGSWLFNPGIEIPAEAAAVHGISTEQAVRDGTDPRWGLWQLEAELMARWSDGVPAIIMNATFDLTIVQAELRRYELPPLEIGPVIDPIVIDRAVDPWRKGKRTLTALAAHYGAKQEEAHSAAGDAITAARIVWKMAQRFPELGAMTLLELQKWQARAHAKWADGFEQYLRKQGKPDVVSRDWPVRPMEEAQP